MCNTPATVSAGEFSKQFRPAQNLDVQAYGLNGRNGLQPILLHLKKHGEAMDFDIAKAVGTPLNLVRDQLAGLAATKEVIMCYVMRFEGAKKIEGYACRMSGYIPPAAPGRKPKGSKPVN